MVNIDTQKVKNAIKRIYDNKEEAVAASLQSREPEGYKWREDGTVVYVSPDITDSSLTPIEILEKGLPETLNPTNLTITNVDSRQWNSTLDGEQITNYYFRITARPKTPIESGEPLWEIVHPAATTTVRVYKPNVAKAARDFKKIVAFGDTQIGFRELEDGSHEAFHDERAMDLAIQIVTEENPDQITILGDFLDLASQGRFAKENSFAKTTQRAINTGHNFLAKLRAAAPNAVIDLVEGNHDKRMQNFIQNDAASAWGLKQANSNVPVMSIPFLLRLDDIQVNYYDAWPANRLWLTNRLYAQHGNKVRSGGSTAAAYTNAEPHLSTIFGHTHRLEIQSKTVTDRFGKIKSRAINPGCLCRVDGAVPSVNGAIGADGHSVTNWENWQQGLVVLYTQGDDKDFFASTVEIEEGVAIFNNKVYTSDYELNGAHFG